MSECFIAVELPVHTTEQIGALQKRIGERARLYGYTGKVTQGFAKPHITIISPPETPGVGVCLPFLTNVTKRHPTFHVSLSGFRHFDNHTIYARIERGAGALTSVYDDLAGELNVWKTPAPNFHVSIARRFPKEEFAALWAATQEVEAAEPIWPIQFIARGLSTFWRKEPETPWSAQTHFRFDIEGAAVA